LQGLPPDIELTQVAEQLCGEQCTAVQQYLSTEKQVSSVSGCPAEQLCGEQCTAVLEDSSVQTQLRRQQQVYYVCYSIDIAVKCKGTAVSW
jgi:hypothetical protein